MIYPIAILAIDNPEDRAFMMRLYEDYHRLMHAQAYRVLQDRQHIDDVISESCIALIGRIAILTQLDCPALRAYIVTTVRNTAINYGKQLTRKRRHTVGDPDIAFDSLPEDSDEIDAGLLLREEVEHVRKAILQLPAAEQNVMRMKYYGNLSNEQIAHSLGIKAEGVRKYLLRARRHVLEIMESGK